MKNLQVLIHRHYDTIKLVLLVLLLFLSLGLILDSVARNRREIEARNEVINTIKEENETQTDIMNRQFRAICFLIIETSGTEALKKLDPETQARCDTLAEEEITEQEADKPVPAQQSQQPQSSSSTSSGSSANNTPSSDTPQPDNSQEPQSPSEPTLLQRVEQFGESVDNAIKDAVGRVL